MLDTYSGCSPLLPVMSTLQKFVTNKLPASGLSDNTRASYFRQGVCSKQLLQPATAFPSPTRPVLPRVDRPQTDLAHVPDAVAFFYHRYLLELLENLKKIGTLLFVSPRYTTKKKQSQSTLSN